MSDKTGIAWTDATWNPVRGCSRVSKGCENCYAEKVAGRFHKPGLPYEGLTRETSKGRVWNGEIMLVEKVLDQPLRWRKPRRIFVNSMSDLFHEGVPFLYIAKVFGVMAAASDHTFQILTKRPERMREFMRWIESPEANPLEEETVCTAQRCLMAAGSVGFETSFLGAVRPRSGTPITKMWPLPNVWLGVSAEDQETADERIPLLLQTPAAVRFVSAEPLLGPIDFENFGSSGCPTDWLDGSVPDDPGIDWIIVGGESGPGARPCNVEWIRSIVEECRGAGVPCFVKQLGGD